MICSISRYLTSGAFYEIYYGAMMSRKIENLLGIGRRIAISLFWKLPYGYNRLASIGKTAGIAEA